MCALIALTQYNDMTIMFEFVIMPLLFVCVIRLRESHVTGVVSRGTNIRFFAVNNRL